MEVDEDGVAVPVTLSDLQVVIQLPPEDLEQTSTEASHVTA